MSFRLIVSVILQLLSNSHGICFLYVVRGSRTFQQVVRLNIETPKALRVDREEASLPRRLMSEGAYSELRQFGLGQSRSRILVWCIFNVRIWLLVRVSLPVGPEKWYGILH